MNKPNIAIDVEKSSLDDVCKTILRKLKQNGFDKAGNQYVVDENEVSNSEFDYLLRHGGISVPGERGPVLIAVLAMYGTPQWGPEVGKIAFKLNVDLV